MIGVIGCGNMGAGFAEGLSRARYDCSNVCLYDHHPEKLESLSKINDKFVICKSEAEVIEKSEIIIFAISKEAFEACINQKTRYDFSQKIIVSFNPDISLQDT